MTASSSSIIYAEKLKVDKNIFFLSTEYIRILKNNKIELDDPYNIDRSFFPSSYILANLAKLSYNDLCRENEDNLNIYEESIDLPPDWRVMAVACNKNNGYFGVAFWNIKDMQITISHRGTDDLPGVWTDVIGIYFNKYVDQMNTAMTFAYRVTEAIFEIKENFPKFKFELSFSGHSLGGWLAQITTFSVKYLKIIGNEFIKNDCPSQGFHAHTEVFDSPGCKEMLTKLKSDFDIRYKKTTISLRELDITSYLSAPNRINTSNFHAGLVYRVFLNLTDTSASNRNYNDHSLLNPSKYINAIFNVRKDWKHVKATHSIDKIVELFESSTGEIKRDEEGKYKMDLVLDWPISSGITGDKEYTNFFEWANSHNNFHPCVNSNWHKNVRYRTQEVPEDSCSLQYFTENEKQFLSDWQVCRDTNVNLDELKSFAEKIKLDDTSLLPDFKIEHDQIVCKMGIKKLVQRTKQIMKLFPDEARDAVKSQMNKIPKVIQLKYEYESEFYIKSLISIDLNFTDSIGFKEFLQSSKKILSIPTFDVEMEVLRILNIIRQLRENTDSEITQYVELNNQTVIQWEQLLKFDSFMDVQQMFKCDMCTDNLFVLAMPENESDLGNISILTTMIENIEYSTSKKLIVVSNNKLKTATSLAFKNHINILMESEEKKALSFSDIHKDSLQKLLSKNIFKGQLKTLMDIFGNDNVLNIKEHAWIEEVTMNKHILKVLSDSEPRSVYNLFLWSDINMLHETVSKKMSIEDVMNSVRYINESTKRSEVRLIIYGDIASVVFNPKDIEIIKTSETVILKENSVNNQYDFEKCCEDNQEKIVSWLEVNSNSIFWKQTYNPNIYINRKFLHEILISLNDIKGKLLRNEDNNELFICYDFEKSRTFEELFDDSEEEVLYTANSFEDAETKFNEESSKNIGFKRSIHLMKRVGDHLVWLRSHGNINAIRKYTKYNQNSVINETDLINKPNRVVILAAEPGMGKSITLFYVAKLMKASWVVNINLRDENTIKTLTDDMTVEEAITFLLGQIAAPRDDFVKFFFESNLKHNKEYPVFVLCDGFDEIRKEEKSGRENGLLRFIEILLKETSAKIWITTRTHRCVHLENRFCTFATKFHYLNSENQRQVLKNIWKSHLTYNFGLNEEDLNKKLDKYAMDLLDAATKDLHRGMDNFVGVPLQIRMIAETSQPDYFIDPKSKDYELTPPTHAKNVYDLYTRFVNAKYGIYFRDKTNISTHYIAQKATEVYLNRQHRRLAFKLVFLKDLAGYLKNSDDEDCKEDEILFGLNAVGLIESKSDSYVFAHRTYAEYFAADLIASWLEKPEGRHPKYKSTLTLLFRNILLLPDYDTLRVFLNYRLQNYRLEDIKNDSITVLENVYSTRYFSNHETALHISVKENNVNLMKMILSGLKCKRICDKYVLYIAKRNRQQEAALHLALQLDYRCKDGNSPILTEFLDILEQCPSEIQEIIITSALFKSHESNKNKEYVHFSECLRIKNAQYENLYKIYQKVQQYDDYVKKLFNSSETGISFSMEDIKDSSIRFYLISAMNDQLLTPIHVAVNNGRMEVVKYLSDFVKAYEIDNMLDNKGKTPVHKAVLSNNMEILKFFVEKGCKVFLRDNNNLNLLCMCAIKGNLRMFKYLMKDLKVKIHRTRDDMEPLHYAARHGHLDIVEYLVSNDRKATSIHRKDRHGRSPIFWAAEYGMVSIVKYLFENGASIDCMDSKNRSLLQIASKNNRVDVIDFLIENKANVQTLDTEGYNALFFAIKLKLWRIAEIMLERSSPISQNKVKKKSLLQIAADNREWKLVKLMLNKGAKRSDLNQKKLEELDKYLNQDPQNV